MDKHDHILYHMYFRKYTCIFLFTNNFLYFFLYYNKKPPKNRGLHFI